MYVSSGALAAGRWPPPPRSSEIAPFSAAFSPVPSAFPEDVPSPRPVPGSAFALTIFPREGVISRRGRSGAGTDGSEGSPGVRDVSSVRGTRVGSLLTREGGASAFGRGTGNSFSGGRSGLTGRSGTRPTSSLGGGTGGFSFRAGFGGEGGGGFGRAPSTIPGRGVGKSAERGRSVRSPTLTSVGRCGVQGIIDASTRRVKRNRAETGTQLFSKC